MSAEATPEPTATVLAKAEELAAKAADAGVAVTDRALADALDAADELASFRDRFHIPPHTNADGTERSSIYLCGNSLGCQPKSLAGLVNGELDAWQKYGVEGHFNGTHPWLSINEPVNGGVARLCGAKDCEVVVMNSLTTNLHLMMVPFYRPTETRYKIVCEGKSFPSDRYAFASRVKLAGYEVEDALVEVFPREGEETLRTEDILSVIAEHGESIALVCFSGVQYYTGQLFDIPAITAAGHEVGAYVGFDCAHAFGNVPLNLHDDGVDFAVFCNYKYLNSGPGAVGAAFIHERHANADLPRFAGWWGHDKSSRFEMGPEFVPTPGAWGFQLSNPPVLQTISLLASLEIFDEATMPRLRAKSELLTGYLEVLLKELIGDDVDILTPADPSARGCQLSLSFKRPIREVHNKITELGVICDVREPNVMRIAPVPLYNSFADVHEFVTLLKAAVKAEEGSSA